MKRYSEISLAVCILLTGTLCRGSGDDPFEANHLENINAPPNSHSNPDHLEPIAGYAPDGYEQEVFRALIGTETGDLWMATTGMGRESAVILRRPKSGGTRQLWALEFVQVATPITKDTGGMAETELSGKAVRRTITVSDELATNLRDAWHAVLVGTKYADQDYRGLDGTIFWFYCKPRYFGTIWSPNRGSPKLLTMLGLRLADLANAPEADTVRLSKECEEIAKIIIDREKTIRRQNGQQPTSHKGSASASGEPTPVAPSPGNG